MGGPSGVFWVGPRCNRKNLCRAEAEGDQTQRRRHPEVGERVTSWERVPSGERECQQPQHSLRRGTSLRCRDFGHGCESEKMRCFEPCGFCSFVPAALGNQPVFSLVTCAESISKEHPPEVLSEAYGGFWSSCLNSEQVPWEWEGSPAREMEGH